MRDTFSSDEVDSLENSAYEVGITVGRLEVIKTIKELHDAGVKDPTSNELGTLVWTRKLLELIEDKKSPR
jgi:hypothetical protein